ncbi:MAG: hypothetical protein SVK54_01550 [candidate division WOR-3 bacterium]|nr:hypothetical protein [candidate division WOR-3 bacterium]
MRNVIFLPGHVFMTIVLIILLAEHKGFDTDYFYIYVPDGWQTVADGNNLFYVFPASYDYFVQINRVDASEKYPDKEMEDIDFENFTLEEKQGFLTQITVNLENVYEEFELIDKDILEKWYRDAACLLHF